DRPRAVRADDIRTCHCEEPKATKQSLGVIARAGHPVSSLAFHSPKLRIAAMKFSELPVGQHFEYEGERYLKSGPLVATHEASGQRRFMPRYGAVTPISAKPETPAPAASPRTVDLGEALAELDA